MNKRFFPLSAITTRINELLQPAITKQFWVKAEIASGRERSGTFFCDLIETDVAGKIIAKIAGTIWPQDLSAIRRVFKARDLDLILADGTVVGFCCSLQFSPQYGISLRVIDADPAVTMGEMELKKRAIIERLQQEGLFTPNKERFVPLLPLKIGLITSAGSAAYNDFIKTLRDSGFGFQIYVADAMMQGAQTENSVLLALRTLCRLGMEVILVIRGGGSKTDLYFLDNEAIARTIAACQVPVWTGIGHEIDTSVLDYVANQAFKTPTAAAEELVARFVQMRRQLDESANALQTVWAYRLATAQEHLIRVKTGMHQGTRKLLDVTVSHLRSQAQHLGLCVQRRIASEQVHIGVCKSKLSSMPLALLKRRQEHLVTRQVTLTSRGRFLLTHKLSLLSSLQQRFDQDRVLRLVHAGLENTAKACQQLRNRFLAVLRVKSNQQEQLKRRFRSEKCLLLLGAASKSLKEKQATLKAVDPQNALKRGFALVYRHDGQLIRSISEVSTQEEIRTILADGSIISIVTTKEVNHE